MNRELICGDCKLWDCADCGFYGSNLCKCKQDGKKRWKGDCAEACGWFVFSEKLFGERN